MEENKNLQNNLLKEEDNENNNLNNRVINSSQMLDESNYRDENKSEKSENNEEENEHFKAKIILASLIVVFLSIFNLAKLGNFTNKVDCFYDIPFEWTNWLNKAMVDHPVLQDVIVLIAGLLEDLSVLLGFIFFCFRFPKWRIVMSLGSIYLVRAIIQNIYLMEIPKQNTFSYPGFPSLFVPYLKTNDFFFSGHVSLPFIVGYEFYKENMTWYAVFCFFTSVYEMIMMYCTRGHYSIDIYAAYIFSTYACMLGTKYTHLLDKTYLGYDYEEKGEDLVENDKLNMNRNEENKEKKENLA